MIVNGNADVVFLYEFFYPGQCRGRRIASDDDVNSSAFAIFEFLADVVVLVLLKVNCSRGMQLDSCCGVIGECGGLRLRIHRQMIFRVFQVYVGHVELLQESEHLRAREIAEGVAGDSEMNWRFSCGNGWSSKK